MLTHTNTNLHSSSFMNNVYSLQHCVLSLYESYFSFFISSEIFFKYVLSIHNFPFINCPFIFSAHLFNCTAQVVIIIHKNKISILPNRTNMSCIFYFCLCSRLYKNVNNLIYLYIVFHYSYPHLNQMSADVTSLLRTKIQPCIWKFVFLVASGSSFH